MLKLEPLTDREFEFIRWRIWEPLRRNQDYKNEFGELKGGYFLDKDKEKAFCDKWKIPYTIDPGIEFDSLLEPKGDETKRQARQRVRGIFYDRYEPLFDHAAFVDFRHWIIDDKYLRVWVNLEASRNSIEAALKKELDEWRVKWKNFYEQNIEKKPVTNAVESFGLTGKYLELHINLEAPRTTRSRATKGYIEPEIKDILSEWLALWEGEKKQPPRLSKTWASCFQIYDFVEQSPVNTQALAAIKFQKTQSTIQKRYQLAWESIYPQEPYTTKRYRKKEIALGSLEVSCGSCENKTCYKTKKPCDELELFVNQDYVPPFGYVSIHTLEDKFFKDADGDIITHAKSTSLPTSSEQFEWMDSPPEPLLLDELEDCKFCQGVLCVHRAETVKGFFCQLCGRKQ